MFRKKKEPEVPKPARYAIYIKVLGKTTEYTVGVTESKQEIIELKHKLDEGFANHKAVVIDDRTFVLDKIVSYSWDRYFGPQNLGWG